MASKIHGVFEWTRTEGEVKAIDRLRVMLLPDLMAEGLTISSVTPDTDCSDDLTNKARDAATTVVGSACPA